MTPVLCRCECGCRIELKRADSQAWGVCLACRMGRGLGGCQTIHARRAQIADKREEER